MLFAGLVTPETILRWYRELMARKYKRPATQPAGSVNGNARGERRERLGGLLDFSYRRAA